MRFIFWLLVWALFGGALLGRDIPEFRPPQEAERRAALGELSGLSEGWRRALREEGFHPVALPGKDDWLAKRQEFAQPLAAYALARRPKITRGGRTLYLLPLGEGVDVAKYGRFLRVYFGLPVRVLPEEAALGGKVLAAEAVLDFLRKRVPKDAFAVVGVTGADLHPGWRVPAERGTRFLFGRARYSGRNNPPRVAVVSTARLEGDFLRTAKLLAHEAGHLFGLAHCVYYRCVMNGSAHLKEADARPVHLCPVCLRKLGTAVRFDPLRRYRDLGKVYSASGMGAEAEWVHGRVRYATGGAQ